MIQKLKFNVNIETSFEYDQISKSLHELMLYTKQKM